MNRILSSSLTTRQKSLVKAMDIEALTKEYQVLCQRFERLKTLVSLSSTINLDLLSLSIDEEDMPEARVEMDKVKKVVQGLMDEGKKWENNTCLTDDRISNQPGHNQSLVDKQSLDHYFDVLALKFTQQELMVAFNQCLERSYHNKSSHNGLSVTICDVNDYNPSSPRPEDLKLSNFTVPTGCKSRIRFDKDLLEIQSKWQSVVTALENRQKIPGAKRFPAQICEKSKSKSRVRCDKEVSGTAAKTRNRGDKETDTHSHSHGIRKRNSKCLKETVGTVRGKKLLKDVLASPLSESNCAESAMVDDVGAGYGSRNRKCVVTRKPIFVDVNGGDNIDDDDDKTGVERENECIVLDDDNDRDGDKNENHGEIGVKSLVPDIVVNETVEVTMSNSQGGGKEKAKGHDGDDGFVDANVQKDCVVNDMFVPTQDLIDNTDEECVVLGSATHMQDLTYKTENGCTVSGIVTQTQDLTYNTGNGCTVSGIVTQTQDLTYNTDDECTVSGIVTQTQDLTYNTENGCTVSGIVTQTQDLTYNTDDGCTVSGIVTQTQDLTYNTENGCTVSGIVTQTQDLTYNTDDEYTVVGIDIEICVEDENGDEYENGVVPGIPQNKETADVIAFKDQAADFLSRYATLASPPHLSDLDSCNEEDSHQTTTDGGGRNGKKVKSQKPVEKPQIKAGQRKKKRKTQTLLEEFGIPLSILDSESEIMCPLCCKELKNRGSFLHHIKSHKRRKVEMEQSEGSKEEPVLCTICGKTFKNRQSMKGHVQQHEIIDKGEYFKCPICGKQYLGKKSLFFHTRAVHAPKTYVCDKCGKAYKSKTVLDDHQKCVHFKMKTEVCQVCSLRFSNRGNLLRHMRIHRGELPYSCSKCGKSFRASDNLRAHEKRHSENFVHRCLLCNHLGFVTLGRLRKHEQTVHHIHQIDKKGDWGLEVEKLKTVTGRQRKRKVDPNSPFQCGTCGKRFMNQGTLKRHMFTHTDLKPYDCPTCGRVFRTRATLKMHSWTHSTVKQFPCTLCDKGYNEKRDYMSHMKRVHPEHFVSTDTTDVSSLSTALADTTTTLTTTVQQSGCLDIHKGEGGAEFKSLLPFSGQIDDEMGRMKGDPFSHVVNGEEDGNHQHVQVSLPLIDQL